MGAEQPSFASSAAPVFAVAGDAKQLPPQTRLSYRNVSCAIDASAVTTYHLDAYLAHHAEDGMDAAAIRSVIEDRGGRVLESQLRPPADLHPLVAGTLRQQFAHFLDPAGVAAENGRETLREREPVA